MFHKVRASLTTSRGKVSVPDVLFFYEPHDSLPGQRRQLGNGTEPPLLARITIRLEEPYLKWRVLPFPSHIITGLEVISCPSVFSFSLPLLFIFNQIAANGGTCCLSLPHGISAIVTSSLGLCRITALSLFSFKYPPHTYTLSQGWHRRVAEFPVALESSLSTIHFPPVIVLPLRIPWCRTNCTI